MTMEHVREVHEIDKTTGGRHRLVIEYLEDGRVDIGTTFATSSDLDWWHENIAQACLANAHGERLATLTTARRTDDATVIASRELVIRTNLQERSVVHIGDRRYVVSIVSGVTGQALLRPATEDELEPNLLRGKGDVERRGDVPPLVLVEGGWQIWRILEPQAMYGRPLTSFGESVHDRRYKEKCVVNGSIDNALKILHELERAR